MTGHQPSRQDMSQSQGASLRETGSHASHEARADLRPTGFDPARIEALAKHCEQRAAENLDHAFDSLPEGWGCHLAAIDFAIAQMDRAVRLREMLAIALAQRGEVA